MALIHAEATLVPSKLELLSVWIPTQAWASGLDLGSLKPVGAYRFDDPAGHVGVEVHLLRSGDGPVLQVPVTYRGGPLTTGLRIGTTHHSALGDRWVYDACSDAVGVTALLTAILTGGRQADLELLSTDGTSRRSSPTTAVGTGDEGPPKVGAFSAGVEGTTTVVRTGAGDLVVEHVLGGARPPAPRAVLEGRWPEHDEPALLAYVR